MPVQWSGLQEFKNQLRNLPKELTAEAGQIVLAAADGAKRETIAAYPSGLSSKNPGALKRGVSMTARRNVISSGGAGAVVRSSAPHAHLFEKGTGVRRTDKGWNRGKMPEAPVSQQMIPIMIRARRQMHVKLIDMVQRHGLVVSQS